MRNSLATQLEFISKTKYLPWEVCESDNKHCANVVLFSHCKGNTITDPDQIFWLKRFPRAIFNLLIISVLKK